MANNKGVDVVSADRRRGFVPCQIALISLKMFSTSEVRIKKEHHDITGGFIY